MNAPLCVIPTDGWRRLVRRSSLPHARTRHRRVGSPGQARPRALASCITRGVRSSVRPSKRRRHVGPTIQPLSRAGHFRAGHLRQLLRPSRPQTGNEIARASCGWLQPSPRLPLQLGMRTQLARDYKRDRALLPPPCATSLGRAIDHHWQESETRGESSAANVNTRPSRRFGLGLRSGPSLGHSGACGALVGRDWWTTRKEFLTVVHTRSWTCHSPWPATSATPSLC
jgi:hypothetical protein